MEPITKMTFLIMCFLCVVTPVLEAARILAIIAVPSISHQMAFQSLWTALSRRGHKVVVLTTNPVNDPSITNLTEIDLYYNYKFVKNVNFIQLKQYPWHIIDYKLSIMSNELIENIYTHSEIRKMYAPDSDNKFDVVIVEIIKGSALYALAHRFKAPLIGIASAGLYSHNYYLLGNPVLPSHPSNWEIGNKEFNLSLWQRLKSFIEQWCYIYIMLNHFYPQQQAIAEKYLGKDIPNIIDMERNISIIFYVQQKAISFIRPTTPNIIALGNFQISKKLSILPKDLDKFLTDAPNGFIYMSLGTNIRTSDLPEHIFNIFYDTFVSLPYKIVWKINKKLINKSDNIYTAKWFPQQSLLAHPKIKLFIYQGGMQSTEEAVYNAVPIIGIPILADQYTNLNKMVSLGVAKYLNFEDISREILNASIKDILNDKRYKERMLKLKAINEDKPYNLLENAIWWIEFVIRHKGAPHLHCNIAHDPWYQRYDMDIIAILSIIIFVILFCILVIIYKLLKIIFNQYKKTKKQINITKKLN